MSSWFYPRQNKKCQKGASYSLSSAFTRYRWAPLPVNLTWGCDQQVWTPRDASVVVVKGHWSEQLSSPWPNPESQWYPISGTCSGYTGWSSVFFLPPIIKFLSTPSLLLSKVFILWFSKAKDPNTSGDVGFSWTLALQAILGKEYFDALKDAYFASIWLC